MSSRLHHQLNGLIDEVSISVDPWGIAHIRAHNRDDLFFAQGWNAARDRLWQIDLARKRGLGLLAQDFGPGYLEQDRAARLLLYRGGMDTEWAAYAPDAREICAAFTAGINAYIREALAGKHPMPPEFGLLGTKPAQWQPEDVVRVRSHSLTRNVTSEVLRAQVLAQLGGEVGGRVDLLRKDVEPRITSELPAGLDPDAITARVLRDFILATAPVNFSAARLAAPLEDAGLWVQPTSLGEIARVAFAEGSNNWVVGAHRTESGRPILCLDPHRTHTLPSVRYIVHLSMPGLDVIGAGEAMVPGISMGHNGTAAFGLTIYGDDQEDLYCYEIHPDDPEFYRYGDGWEKMTTLHEMIPVKGHPDQSVTLCFTRHGPVLHREGKHAFALRTVWSGPGTAPYMASLSVMRAKTRDDYLNALRGWGCPSVNHIYGDTANDIVWKPSGASPQRLGWSGLLPVPGDGRFEWQGLQDPGQTPYEINPERGFIATANAHNLPPQWNGARPGYEWLDPSRHDFLNAALAENGQVTLEDCAAMQVSTQSAIAAGLANWLRAWPECPAQIAGLIAPFNGDLAIDSAAAAFIEVWLSRYLGPALARLEGATEAVLPLLAPYDPPSLLRGLQEQNVVAPEIAASLDAAWADCVTLMGQNTQDWAWGALHQLELRHPLHALCPDWSRAAVPRGGSSSSANYAGYRAQDFAVTMGPSVRMLIDIGAWDNSRFINTPGQSGDPRSDHYGDLADSWANGTYAPLLYSWDEIMKVSKHHIQLSPVDTARL